MTEQPIKRNRYFDDSDCQPQGRNLDEDFRNFHLRSFQAQLASLHNWGIAQGLEVSGTLGSSTITINAGVAVDTQGRLIVLATEGRGDLGNNPPGGNHNPVTVPVELDTSTFAGETDTSYYLTIQFSEILRFDDGGTDCGRLEQTPWLRLQPVSEFTEDGTAVVLAVVTLDSSGNIVALAHQDSSLPVARHLVGKTVGQLQITRSQKVGDRITEVIGGKLQPAQGGGLQLSVADAGDQILLTQESGTNFARLEVQVNTFTTPGNVGIGTATPSQKLEVNGAIAATALSVTGTVTANAFEGDGSALTGKVSTAGDTMTGPLTIDANLSVGYTDATPTAALAVRGNVGIGTSTPEPEVALEVRGKAKITEGLVPNYDSGWFQVQTNSHYLLTHNLATSLLLVQILYKDPNGRVWDARTTFRYFSEGSNHPEPLQGFCGFYLLMKDDNTFDFATAGQLVFGGDNTETYGYARRDQRWTTGEYRVFAWKIGV